MTREAEAVQRPLLRTRLPLPPGVNHSYQVVVNRQSGRSRLAATRRLAEWKKQAALWLLAADVDQAQLATIRQQRRTELAACLCFFFADRRRRDIDGGIKPVLDACFAALALDDSSVTRLLVTKQVTGGEPGVAITVWQAEFCTGYPHFLP